MFTLWIHTLRHLLKTMTQSQLWSDNSSIHVYKTIKDYIKIKWFCFYYNTPFSYHLIAERSTLSYEVCDMNEHLYHIAISNIYHRCSDILVCNKYTKPPECVDIIRCTS